METTEVLAACEYIREATVNIGMEFGQTVMGDTLFQLRATPWRNSSRGDVMILAAAPTIGDALILIADEIAENHWVPLNWKVRLDEYGTYVPALAWRSMRNGREELKKLPNGPQPHNREKDTSDY